MKITIYVHEKYLENLDKFLKEGVESPIEYHHDRPGTFGDWYYMVTITYSEFKALEDLSE